MIGLTRRQADVLRYVCGYQEAHDGVSPSYRDMNAVFRCGLGKIKLSLEGLEWRGNIRRLPNRARAIEVLQPLPIPRAPDGAPLFFVRISA